MAWGGAMNEVGARVTKMVTKRYADLQEKPDAVFYVIDASRTPQQRSPARVVQQMVALQFASAHQLPMALAWAIIMLCKHNGYIDMLREEIQESKEAGGLVSTSKLRLMDCFLRETARLNPLDGLSIQRKAVKPFTFADGSHIPAGNLLAVPQEAILRDKRYYPNPGSFDPWRFYSPADSDKAIVRFTDVNWKFPFWGSPTQSCPGRWYASDVIKYALVHLLENYDMEPVNPIYRPMIWTTAIAPSLTMRVMLKPCATSYGK
ncbi:unnamed protein product [Clonostachys byssicola]|uniref:Cytochrome P450 n=1 Tax=Clonostachys byssicola TaxID=160290 RepID=A0A9N9UHD4_9HYPO|nr:unnamed protein product [Clonostachys byssicola]